MTSDLTDDALPLASLQAPALRKTLADLCDHRDQALNLYFQAIDLIAKANDHAQQAAPGGGYRGSAITYEIGRHLSFMRAPRDVARITADIRTELDRNVWRSMLQVSALAELMDATAKEDFERSLEKQVPAATYSMVGATLQTLAALAPDMVERGIVQLFRGLAKRYRTNGPVLIGRRIKLANAMTACNNIKWQSWNRYRRGDNELQDLERFLHIVAGQRPPEASDTIVAKIDHHRLQADAERQFETDLLKVRWFQNGNLDVEIKRDDLVARINQIIGKHCGEDLPAARGRRT